MKLRNMNAEVISCSNVFIKDGDNEIMLEDGLCFISYRSKCAFYDKEDGIVYLLPRYDFSPTTCRQLSAFLEDFCGYERLSIKDIRKYARFREYGFVLAGGYRFAADWYPDFKKW